MIAHVPLGSRELTHGDMATFAPEDVELPETGVELEDLLTPRLFCDLSF